MEQKSETELRSLDSISELTAETKGAWDRIKSQMPSDVRQQFEPYVSVLTDAPHVERIAGTRSGG